MSETQIPVVQSPQLPQDPSQWLGHQRDLSALPHQQVRVVTGAFSSEAEATPAGAYGHLAHEVSLLQGAADGHVTDGRMGQRIRMAIHTRESAIAALEANGNDAKAAIAALKQERKAAIRSHDSFLVDNVDREITLLRRAKSNGYPGAEWTVQRVLESRNPQFGEKGVIRGFGSSVLRGVGLLPPNRSPLSNAILESMRPQSTRERHQRTVAKSIGNRAVQLAQGSPANQDTNRRILEEDELNRKET